MFCLCFSKNKRTKEKLLKLKFNIKEIITNARKRANLQNIFNIYKNHSRISNEIETKLLNDYNCIREEIIKLDKRKIKKKIHL
jgi:hypothetical protein